MNKFVNRNKRYEKLSSNLNDEDLKNFKYPISGIFELLYKYRSTKLKTMAHK